jgi:hypothetical protein
MKYGMDYLLGAKYKRLILDEHPEGFYAGFFMEEGGPLGEMPTKLLETGRCPGIRFQGLWAGKGHNYNSAAQLHRAQGLFEDAKALKRAFPDKEVQFSPFCEHNLDRKTTRHVFTTLKNQGTDGVLLVNSVWKGAIIQMEGVINEIHGMKAYPPKGRFNHSWDGTDCFASNIQEAKNRYRRAEIMFMWAPPLNCKRKLVEDIDIPPMERTYKPTAGHIRTLEYEALIRRGKTSMVKGGILKPVAEESENFDVKSNRVCVIVPGKYKQVEFRTSSEIIVLPYFGPFDGGGYRYYSKDWGYEIAEQLSVLPCRLIGIKKNGEKENLGRVHPAFRCGSYRDE